MADIFLFHKTVNVFNFQTGASRAHLPLARVYPHTSKIRLHLQHSVCEFTAAAQEAWNAQLWFCEAPTKREHFHFSADGVILPNRNQNGHLSGHSFSKSHSVSHPEASCLNLERPGVLCYRVILAHSQRQANSEFVGFPSWNAWDTWWQKRQFQAHPIPTTISDLALISISIGVELLNGTEGWTQPMLTTQSKSTSFLLFSYPHVSLSKSP